MDAVRVRVGSGRYMIVRATTRGWYEPAFNGQTFTARESLQRLRDMETADA